MLVSIGRRPVTEDIGPPRRGVRVDQRGFIEVDTNTMLTSRPGVYAIGDCVNTPGLAHVAYAEAVLAVDHFLGENPVPVDYGKVPWVVYTHPEVAWSGMTEAEAREAGHDVVVHKHSFAGNGRAMILGETDGLVKIVAQKDGPILGFHMVGPWASELLHEGYLAVNWEALPADVGRADPRPPEPVRGHRRNHDHFLRPFPARLSRRGESTMSDEWVVTMPKLGETVTEGTVGNWLKQVGDTVAFDDPLFEVSTDKVDSEIPSPYDGVVLEIMVPAGRPCRSARRWCGSASPGSAPVAGRPAAARRRTGWPQRAVRRSTTRPARPWAAPRAPRAPAPRSAVPGGEVHDITMPKLGRDRHRGHGRQLAQAGRRHGRVRRPAVRGVHRQGRLGDPQPVRRRAAGDPRRRGRDRAGRHRAGPHRRARARTAAGGGRAPAPGGGGAAAACRRAGRPGDGAGAPAAADRGGRAALAARAPARGGERAGRRRDHRHRRGRPDPARGRESARSPRAGPGAAPPPPPRPLPRLPRLRRPPQPAAAPAAPAAPRRPQRRRRRRATRSCQLSRMRLAVAAGMKASQTLAASRVDLRRGRLRQRRAGAGEAQGPVQEGDRRVAVVPAVRRAGGGRRAAGVSRPSTPRSTSRRRR